uniref:Uncharacterized protein n=1 Tax=Triticum urartu TaxID=4572 RepID=A0A8R7PR24_TRIUA
MGEELILNTYPDFGIQNIKRWCSHMMDSRLHQNVSCLLGHMVFEKKEGVLNYSLPWCLGTVILGTAILGRSHCL